MKKSREKAIVYAISFVCWVFIVFAIMYQFATQPL